MATKTQRHKEKQNAGEAALPGPPLAKRHPRSAPATPPGATTAATDCRRLRRSAVDSRLAPPYNRGAR